MSDTILLALASLGLFHCVRWTWRMARWREEATSPSRGPCSTPYSSGRGMDDTSHSGRGGGMTRIGEMGTTPPNPCIHHQGVTSRM